MDLGSRLDRLESDYLRPAKQFLTQSFENNPTATMIAAVFAVTSVVPVVSAIALAVFASFVAVAGLLTTLVGLVASLLVVLSATLVFSAAATLLFSAVVRSRGQSAPTTQNTVPEPASRPTIRVPGLSYSPWRAFTAFRHLYPQKGPSWRARLLIAILFRNTFGRIFLPRWMRYHRFYPYVFGFERTPHPLKWVLLRGISPVLAVAAVVFNVGRVVRDIVSVVGVGSIILAGALLWFGSPRGREARKTTLAVLVPLLRNVLETLERMVVVDTPAGEEHPTPATVVSDRGDVCVVEVRDRVWKDTETAQDETVSSVVPPGQSAATTSVSTTGGVIPDIKARNVGAAGV